MNCSKNAPIPRATAHLVLCVWAHYPFGILLSLSLSLSSWTDCIFGVVIFGILNTHKIQTRDLRKQKLIRLKHVRSCQFKTLIFFFYETPIVSVLFWSFNRTECVRVCAMKCCLQVQRGSQDPHVWHMLTGCDSDTVSVSEWHLRKLNLNCSYTSFLLRSKQKTDKKRTESKNKPINKL